MIFRIPAAKGVQRGLQYHHFGQRDNGHQIITVRRGQRGLELLQLRHRAVYAQLAAIHFNHSHHARLVEIDPQTLGPLGQRRGVLFRLNQVHHQLFAQTAILGQEMHQPRLFQHHLGGHTHQFTVFTQRLRFAGQADNADDLPFQTQRQVDPLAHAVQMSGNGIINIDNAALGKH